jgi:hypothetical protein
MQQLKRMLWHCGPASSHACSMLEFVGGLGLEHTLLQGACLNPAKPCRVTVAALYIACVCVYAGVYLACGLAGIALFLQGFLL